MCGNKKHWVGALILTRVLWKAWANADLQHFVGRFQRGYISLTLHELHLPRTCIAPRPPALLLQLHLQPGQQNQTLNITTLFSESKQLLTVYSSWTCSVGTYVLANLRGSFLWDFSSCLRDSKLMNSVLKTHSSRLSYSCSWRIRKSSCRVLHTRKRRYIQTNRWI